MSKKIMIVDDSMTMRKIIKQILTAEGFDRFIEAEDGNDALNKLRLNDDVDLILTDWNMPQMDGMTFLKAVKSTDAFKNIPVAMITTESAKEEIIEALKVGAKDYIVKPFKPDIVRDKVKKILGA